MLRRTALAALLLACCATPAVAAPTAITEFQSEPKAKYIEGSPLNSSVWITIEGVGIQQYATGDGEALATARGALNVAASDLAVDVDGSVTWTLPIGIQGPPGFAGWARRNFTGSITRTQAGNANTADAVILPSPGASPLITGHYPTYNDCIYTATNCVMVPQGRLDDQLTGLGIDGGGRVWAFSQNKDQAFRLALNAGQESPADKIVTMPAGTQPRRAARGPDGNLWIAGAGGRIVRMTPEGALTSFTLPAGRGPNDIVLGPDNALWFTEKTSNSIGRITTAGGYRSFPVPSAASQPFGIGVGPDRNIWFTEFAGGRIGKLVPGDDVNAGTVPIKAVKDTTKPKLGPIGLSRTKIPRCSLRRLGQSEEAQAGADGDEGLVHALRGGQGQVHRGAQGPWPAFGQAVCGAQAVEPQEEAVHALRDRKRFVHGERHGGPELIHLPRPARREVAQGRFVPPHRRRHRPVEEHVGIPSQGVQDRPVALHS